MSKLNLFIPITKIDAAQRLVYGVATADRPDVAKEICDYATTKPFYEKWSEQFAKATDGKSLGNLRAMHGKVAAGKLTAVNYNDDDKQIEICGKVVDDGEWDKVEQGVYTGFSQGGRYVKRWKDGEFTRYTAEPMEISLVDSPCLPSATFEIVKADGSSEMRKFKPSLSDAAPAISNEEVAAKATELAKAAGDEAKWPDHIAAARAKLEKAAAPAEQAEPPLAPSAEDGSDYEQVWKSGRDGATFKKKADLLAHHVKLDAEAAAKPAADPVLDKIAEIKAEFAGKPPAQRAFVIVKALASELAKAVTPEAKAAVLCKGLYDVARLANLLSELSWLYDSIKWEALTEGDGSPVPASLQSAMASLCGVLRALVAEETAELVGGADIAVFEMAAGLVPHGHLDALAKAVAADKDALAKDAGAVAPLAKLAEIMEKVGARHSKSDVARIGKMHDLAVELGAACETEKMAKATGELERLTAENTALKAKDGDHVAKLDEVLSLVKTLKTDNETLKTDLTAVRNQPSQGGPLRMQPVFKGQDGGAIAGTDAIVEAFGKMSADDQVTAMIKLSQQRGLTTAR